MQQIQGFFSLQITCPDCRGQRYTIDNPCKECQGKGHASKAREIQVKIPAGVDNGMQIRLSGEGESLETGVPRGDLYCEIEIRPHSIFKRQGDDVILEFPITFTQAALGAESRNSYNLRQIKVDDSSGNSNWRSVETTQYGFSQFTRARKR